MERTTTLYHVVVPLVPKGQMRARSRAFNGHATTYKAPKQKQAENAIMSYLAQTPPPCKMSGPLRLGVRAYMPIPGSKSKAWKQDARDGLIRLLHLDRTGQDLSVKALGEVLTSHGLDVAGKCGRLSLVCNDAALEFAGLKGRAA